MPFRLVWRAALILVAAVAALLPIPPPLVERRYSTSAYLIWQAFATPMSNRVSFALLDPLIAATLAGWVAALAIDVRRRVGWLRGAGRLAARTGVLAAALYLAFLLAWGLNYRRVPLAEKLELQPVAMPEAVRDLAIVSVDRANALYDRAHAAMSGGADSGLRLADGFAEVQRELGAARLAVAARPKHTLLDFYFRAAGVDGMTDPYLLETLVPRDLLPFERPFVVAHEWSHLAGYADEGEASFVGWLTCLRAGDADQYSGWLFIFGEVSPLVMPPADRDRIARRLAPGPRDDLRAIGERRRRNVNLKVALTGWRVYDRYLKANRVEAGAASYAGVVRLALGTRFGPGWTPLMRRSPG